MTQENRDFHFHLFVLFTPDEITMNTEGALVECLDNSDDVSQVDDKYYHCLQ